MTDVLNWPSFCHLAQRMIEVSQKLGDDWYFKHNKDEPGGSYLVKKAIAADPLQDKAPFICVENADLIEDEGTVSQPILQLLSYEYHIVFSLSYSVPVLYFNVHKQDGALLKLEEIWARVPVTYTSQLETQKWSMLTQQEHPLLGIPFYMLHPCNTKHLMEQIKKLTKINEDVSNKSNNYLISWLSSIGPVVGLNLSSKYAL